jgi:hypothetical protein
MENTASERDKNRVGMIMFIKLMKAWSQPVHTQMSLLNVSEADRFNALIEGASNDISEDSLVRISYMTRIYRYLHTIFANKNQADSWVSKSNKIFDDLTVIEYMVSNGTRGMEDVCDYLSAQCQ